MVLIAIRTMFSYVRRMCWYPCNLLDIWMLLFGHIWGLHPSLKTKSHAHSQHTLKNPLYTIFLNFFLDTCSIMRQYSYNSNDKHVSDNMRS